MNKIIKWGFIGLGNASNTLSREFNKLENTKLIAVASKDEGKREIFKKKFKLSDEKIYNDYEHLIYDKEIDLVYVALPNALHKDICLKALKNNKNILVEKPIVTNFNEFLEIESLLNKNLIFEEGLAYRFHPFYKKIFLSLNDINKSEIISIKSSFGNDAVGGKKIFGIRLKKINLNKRLFNFNLGGGAILDGGIYPISIITDILVNKFNRSSFNFNITSCQKKKLSNKCDIRSSINLKINKIDITIETSLEDNLKNYVEIITTKGNIIIENIFHINHKTTIIKNINGVKTILKCLDKNNSYYYQIKHLSNLIETKTQNNQDFLKNILIKKFNSKLLSEWFYY